MLLNNQFDFEIRNRGCSGSATARGSDETAQRSQMRDATRRRRSGWQGWLAIAVFRISYASDETRRRAVVANGWTNQLVSLHRRDNVLLEMLHRHGRNIPELLQQLVRFGRVLVHHYFPQHSVALVQNLENTTICQDKRNIKGFYRITFPGMKQNTPSTVYL